MILKVFLLAIFCLSPFITQIKAECIIHSTSQNDTIQPKFLKNNNFATSLILIVNQIIRLDDGETIIGLCNRGFDNIYSNASHIKISCESDKVYIIHDKYGHLSTPTHLYFDCYPQKVTCRIDFPSNKAVRPKLFKTFGSRILQFKQEYQTVIQNGRELVAKCDTNFKSPNQQRTELNLTCLNGEMIALGYPYNPYDPYENKYRYLECESLKLYESSIQFPWCPSSMASYLLASPVAQGGYKNFAGICYDLDQTSLTSFYFATKPGSKSYFSPKILQSFEPLVEITDIDKIFMFTNSVSKFINGTIIQNQRLLLYMAQPFNQLVNIDWWPALQRGNWQLYEQALVKHVESDKKEFDLLAGVSPPYVWNYLKSLDNCSNDVVVIGVNTPFADSYTLKELIFCEDICHKIDWLKNTRRTFQLRSIGSIFCCNVDDVVTSGRLEGFAVPTTPMTPQSLPLLNLYGDKTTDATG